MQQLDPPIPANGVHASVVGASLPSFIQLCATSGERVIYRVLSHQRAGYLYFDEGCVVHARTPSHQGMDAACEIVGWDRGTIEPWPGPWPKQTSLRMSPQHLLIEAAYRQDESAKAQADLIPLELHRKDEDDDETDMGFPHHIRNPDYAHAVVVDQDGYIHAGKGDDQEELAGIACYSAMLAELVGDALGLEGFMGLDARLADADCALRRLEQSWGLAIGRRGSAQELPWGDST